MTSTLRSRLLAAEGQFLAAFGTGQQAVATFGATWTRLLNDLAFATKTQQLDADTQSLAHIAASRIAIIAEAFSSLDVEAEKIVGVLNTDIDGILSQEFSQRPTDCESLDVIASRWLLQNINDPYPPSDVKASISQSCEVPVKAVQDWFASARRQIGWSAFLQEKFGGSRRNMLDAAALAYRSADQGTLSPDVSRAFMAIRGKVHELLPHYPVPSEGGGQLQPPAPLDFEEEDTTPPPPIAGRKRSFSGSTESAEEGFSRAGSRPLKRHRYMRPLYARVSEESTNTTCSARGRDAATYNNSSPLDLVPITAASDLRHPSSAALSATSVSTIQADDISDNTGIRSTAPADPGLVSCRKRRLSEATSSQSLKRPRGFTSGPRKQVVSNPLPMSLGHGSAEVWGTEEWLQLYATPSQPISIDALDPSSLFDAEFASFSMMPHESASFTGPVLPVSQLDVSDSDLASATEEGFDLSTFTTQNLSSPSTLDGCDSIAGPFDSSASSPSSVQSTSELSEYGMADNPLDWSQLIDFFQVLDASPTSTYSSLSDFAPASYSTPDGTSLPNTDDIPHTLFGMDPSFTSSDFLSDITGFSYLNVPQETVF